MIVISRITLLRQLAERGVHMLTGHAVTSIDDGGLKAAGPDGGVRVDADTVIAAFAL